MHKFRLSFVFHFLNASLLAFMSWLTVSYFDRIQGKIPVHFGIDGVPDRWSDKNILWTFLLVPLLLNLFLYALILFLPRLGRYPALINMKNKEQFLALPPEKQLLFWALIQEFITILTCCLNVSFLGLLWGTIMVGMNEAEKIPGWALWSGVASVGIVMIIYIPRLNRTPTKLIEEYAFPIAGSGDPG
ncbi:MAG: DUF1648 domain-containing protein [bacterium]|nr:DUF1648 domain-containing protein [bacterium]